MRVEEVERRGVGDHANPGPAARRELGTSWAPKSAASDPTALGPRPANPIRDPGHGTNRVRRGAQPAPPRPRATHQLRRAVWCRPPDHDSPDRTRRGDRAVVDLPAAPSASRNASERPARRRCSLKRVPLISEGVSGAGSAAAHRSKSGPYCASSPSKKVTSGRPRHVRDLLPADPLDDGRTRDPRPFVLARETLCMLDVGPFEAHPHEGDEHPLIHTQPRLLPEPIPHPEVAVLAPMSQRSLPIEPRMPQLVVHEPEQAPTELQRCVPKRSTQANSSAA